MFYFAKIEHVKKVRCMCGDLPRSSLQLSHTAVKYEGRIIHEGLTRLSERTLRPPELVVIVLMDHHRRFTLHLGVRQ